MARTRFSVATLNARNLVNPETNYYRKPDGSWNRYSRTAFARKVEWLAEQLVRLDADHVCLQEVFHAEALQAVAERHAALVAVRGLSQPPFASVLHFPNDKSRPDDPSPGLGYLGRTVPLAHRRLQDLSADPIELGRELGFSYRLTATSRPIAIVEIALADGVPALLFNTHLKSKRPLLPEGSPAADAANLLFLERASGEIASQVLRAGEALALRRELLRAMRDNSRPVFVVGDLNDETDAVTTQVVAGEAPWRNERDMAVKRAFWDVELYHAARVHLRRSEHGDMTTHIYNGAYGTLDHIFFSQEFYYRNRAALGDLDYVQVFNDHLVDSSAPGVRENRDASDHGQVVARFSLKEPAAPTG